MIYVRHAFTAEEKKIHKFDSIRETEPVFLFLFFDFYLLKFNNNQTLNCQIYELNFIKLKSRDFQMQLLHAFAFSLVIFLSGTTIETLISVHSS